MLIDPAHAHEFLQEYQRLLAVVIVLSPPQEQTELMTLLANARDRMRDTPGLMQQALQNLEQQGEPLAPAVLQAVQSMRVDRWVYLRDTADYSVVLESRPGYHGGYAVRCLTTPLHELLDGQACVMDCGLMLYHGQVVCDGLVRVQAWLAANPRRALTETWRGLRRVGKFWDDRLLPAAAAA